MIDLSIIIVNYNVKHFLTQCLISILKEGSIHISFEIIVVDNASTDDSFPFLEEKFKGKVRFIKNSENLGFGQACNIGFEQAHGKIILFLNPDTLVPGKTIDECIKILKHEENNKVSAVGVKLLDGSGRYLPESKRSFPTIWNSFSKLSGLAKIFPKSKFFGGYNLTYLHEDSPTYVDALCGAFLMVRSRIFAEIKGFDPDYFMYGEDLDLCRRIKLNGGEILYFPKVNIVHFKGESHKQKDLKYYSRFYNAMNIYAGKHFTNFTSFLIKAAILLAGGISYFANRIFLHLVKIIDFFALFGWLYFIKVLWARFIYHNEDYYDNSSFFIYAITFPLVIVLSLSLSGFYSKNRSFRNTFTGFALGGLLSLAIYSLFPESWRFSRSILILFLLTVPSMLWLLRTFVYSFFKLENEINNEARRIAYVGDCLSYRKFVNWSKFLDSPIEVIGYIHKNEEGSLGSLDSLKEIIESYSLDELIFDNGYEDFDKIYETLAEYGKVIKFKVAGDREMGIIGSNDSKMAGDIYIMDFNYKIASQTSILLKRITDLVFAVTILITFPFWIFYKRTALSNAIEIIKNKKTWVGYARSRNEIKLPAIKPAVISINRFKHSLINSDDYNHEDNFRYAKNYSIFVDLELIFKYLFSTKGDEADSI